MTIAGIAVFQIASKWSGLQHTIEASARRRDLPAISLEQWKNLNTSVVNVGCNVMNVTKSESRSLFATFSVSGGLPFTTSRTIQKVASPVARRAGSMNVIL